MMLTVMSDTHFGFGSGTERWDDAFIAFEEGVERGLEGDAVLLGGDIFDNRTPTTDTFARVMKILLKPKLSKGASDLKPLGDKKPANHGFPVISISGNHERRVKGLVNPVEALEMGGFLAHLHCSGVMLEKGREKVAIQGMSSVPEQFFIEILGQWNPRPVDGAYNIFIFHQNLEGFMYSDKALPKECLPKGFDLYICGDIHESHRSEVHGKPLILPGSTVSTQIKKEAAEPRIFARVDTATGNMDFVPFENQRKIIYRQLESREEAEKLVQETLLQEHKMKPVVKIVSKEDLADISRKYSEKAILRVSQEKDLQAVTIEQQKLSAQQSGSQLLEKNLKAVGLDSKVFHDLFELLLEKRQDEARQLLEQAFKPAMGNSKDGRENSEESRPDSTVESNA